MAWNDITVSDEYKQLSPRGRARLKQRFFEESILPDLATISPQGQEKAFNRFMETPDDTGEGLARSMLGSAARGFLDPLAAVPEVAGAYLGIEGLEEFGGDVRGAIEGAFPVNPAEQGLVTDTFGVLGQVGQIVATGGGGAVAGAKLLGRGATEAAKRQAMRFGATAAQQTAMGSSAVAGGLERAEQLGLEGGDRLLAGGIKGGIEFAAERLGGFATELGPVNKMLGESIESGFMKPIIRGIGTEALEEGGAEAAGQATDIAMAPEAAPGMDLKNIGYAMLLGGVGGAAFGGIEAAITPRTKKAFEFTDDFTPSATPPPGMTRQEADDQDLLVYDNIGNVIGYRTPQAPVTAETIEAELPVEIAPAVAPLVETVANTPEASATAAALQRSAEELRAAEANLEQAEDEGILMDVFADERAKAVQREDAESAALREAGMRMLTGQQIPTETIPAQAETVTPAPVAEQITTEQEDQAALEQQQPTETSAIPQRLSDAKASLNERARSLGFSSVRQMNVQLMLNENVPPEQRQILDEYGKLNQELRSLEWQDTSQLSDEDFSVWSKPLFVSEVTNEGDLADMANLYNALTGRGEIDNANKVLDVLSKTKRRKTDWTPQSWEQRFPGDEKSAVEISIINSNGEVWNENLEALLQSIQGQPTETNVPLTQETLQQEQSRDQELQEPRELPILPAEPTAQAPEAASGRGGAAGASVEGIGTIPDATAAADQLGLQDQLQEAGAAVDTQAALDTQGDGIVRDEGIVGADAELEQQKATLPVDGEGAMLQGGDVRQEGTQQVSAAADVPTESLPAGQLTPRGVGEQGAVKPPKVGNTAAIPTPEEQARWDAVDAFTAPYVESLSDDALDAFGSSVGVRRNGVGDAAYRTKILGNTHPDDLLDAIPDATPPPQAQPQPATPATQETKPQAAASPTVTATQESTAAQPAAGETGDAGVAQVVAKTHQELRDHAANNKSEMRVAINGNTGEEIARVKGKWSDEYFAESADWETDEQFRSWLSTDGIIDMHTHPDETSFSDGDWSVFSSSQVRELHVVTQSGKLYTLKKTDEWDNSPWQSRTPRKIRDRWNEITDDFLADNSTDEIIRLTNLQMAKEFGVEMSLGEESIQPEASVSPSGETVESSETPSPLSKLQSYISTLSPKAQAAWTPERLEAAQSYYATGNESALEPLTATQRKIVMREGVSESDAAAYEAKQKRQFALRNPPAATDSQFIEDYNAYVNSLSDETLQQESESRDESTDVDGPSAISLELSNETESVEQLPDTASLEEVQQVAPVSLANAAAAAASAPSKAKWLEWMRSNLAHLMRFAEKIWKQATATIAVASSILSPSGTKVDVSNDITPQEYSVSELVAKPSTFGRIAPWVASQKPSIKVSQNNLDGYAAIDLPKVSDQGGEVILNLSGIGETDMKFRKSPLEQAKEAAKEITGDTTMAVLPKRAAKHFLNKGSAEHVDSMAEMLYEQESTSPKIAKMLKDMGISESPDTFPWCATSASYALTRGGTPVSITSSRAFLKFGKATQNPQYGDVVVMWNNNPATGGKSGWGGHVGFYLGEVDGTIAILSGNVNDEVNVSLYSKDRVLGYREVSKLKNVASTVRYKKILRSADGSIRRTGVKSTPARAARNSYIGVIPGVENTWLGTVEEFDAEFPDGYEFGGTVTRPPDDSEALTAADGRPFIFLDRVAVLDGDAERAEQHGTSPGVEAIKRLLRHESFIHRGYMALPGPLKNRFADFVASGIIPPEDLDFLVNNGYPHYKGWRDNKTTEMLAAEEWLAQRVERMGRIPQSGPIASIMDWLRDVWRWLTGGETTDLDKLRNTMRAMHKALGALDPRQRIVMELPDMDVLRRSGIAKAGQGWQTVRITPAERKFLSSLGSADFEEMLGRREIGDPFEVYSEYIRILPEYVEPLARYIEAVSSERAEERGAIPPSFHSDEFTKRLRSSDSSALRKSVIQQQLDQDLPTKDRQDILELIDRNSPGVALDFRALRNAIGLEDYVLTEVQVSDLAFEKGTEALVDPSKAIPEKGAIVVGPDMSVIDGRHRSLLAKQKGQKTIEAWLPVSVAENLARQASTSSDIRYSKVQRPDPILNQPSRLRGNVPEITKPNAQRRAIYETVEGFEGAVEVIPRQYFPMGSKEKGNEFSATDALLSWSKDLLKPYAEDIGGLVEFLAILRSDERLQSELKLGPRSGAVVMPFLAQEAANRAEALGSRDMRNAFLMEYDALASAGGQNLWAFKAASLHPDFATNRYTAMMDKTEEQNFAATVDKKINKSRTIQDVVSNLPEAGEVAADNVSDGLAEEKQISDKVLELGASVQGNPKLSERIRQVISDVLKRGFLLRAMEKLKGEARKSIIPDSNIYDGLTLEEMEAELARLDKGIADSIDFIENEVAKDTAKEKTPSDSAQRIINRIINKAKRKERKEGKPDPVEELYKADLKSPMNEADFIEKAVELGVEENVALELKNAIDLQLTAKALEGALGTLGSDIESNIKKANEQANKFQKRADALIDNIVNRMADPPLARDRKTKAVDPLQKAYRDQLKKPVSREEFIASLEKINVFDQTASLLFDAAEMERASREAISAARKLPKLPIETAKEIINKITTAAAKVPAKKKQPDAVRSLYRKHLKKPMSEAEFSAEAKAAGLDAATTKELYDAINLEIVAIEIQAQARAAERAQTKELKKAEREAEKYQNQAEAKINEVADALADPSLTQDKEKVVNPLTEIYQNQIKTPITEPQFVEQVVALGVDEETATLLFSIAAMDRQARIDIRVAREDLRRREMSEAQASKLIYAQEEELRQGSKDREPSKSGDSINKAFREQVVNPLSQEKFRERLDKLKVSQKLADRLYATAERVATDNERAEVYRKRVALLDVDSAALTRFVNDLRLKGKLTGEPIQWRDLLSLPVAHQDTVKAELLARVKRHEALRNLSTGEQQAIADALNTIWQRERRKVFQAMIKKADLMGVSKEDQEVIVEAMPALLKYINQGMLGTSAFYRAVGEKFGIAPISAEARKQVEEMAAKMQEKELYSFERAVLAEKILKILQNNTQLSRAEILSSFWVTSVLSGGRTIFDMALGVLNGGFSIAKKMITATIETRSPKAAIEGLTAFGQGIWMGAQVAAKNLIRPEEGLLASRNPAVADYFDDGARGAGLTTGDKLLLHKGDKPKDKLRRGLGVWMSFFERLFSGLDHINSTATMMGTMRMAAAMNPKLYNAALTPTKQDYANAMERAKLRLPDGSKAAQIRLAQSIIEDGQHILERGLDESFMSQWRQLVADSRAEGNTASYQEDPTGAGGLLYSMVRNITAGLEDKTKGYRDEARVALAEARKAGRGVATSAVNYFVASLGYLLGTQAQNLLGVRFMRFTGNKLNELISFIPVLGMARLQEKGMVSGEDYTLRGQNVRANQVLGWMSAAIYLMLLNDLDEEDDDERGWIVNGSWDNLTPERKSQLMSDGFKPNTVAFFDKDTGRWTSYNFVSWPFAGWMAAFGSVSDYKRLTPEKWNEKILIDKTMAAAYAGAFAITDISSLSSLTEMFGRSTYTTDPAEGFQKRVVKGAANYLGGFFPKTLKDVDAWFDETNYKPEETWEHFAKEVPFYRRNTGAPLRDIFYEPVQVSRTPWSRALQVSPDDPAYKALGRLNSRGIWLTPANPENRKVKRGGKLRDITDEEANAYMAEVGKRYKEFVMKQGDRLLEMDVDRAEELVSKYTARIREIAFKRAIATAGKAAIPSPE